MWVAVFNRCWVEGKRKLLQAVGFLQLLRAFQPLIRLDPGPRNPDTPGVCGNVYYPLPLSCLVFPEKELLRMHMHTQLCLNTDLSTHLLTQISHAHSPGHIMLSLASIPTRGTSILQDNSCLLLSPTVNGLWHQKLCLHSTLMAVLKGTYFCHPHFRVEEIEDPRQPKVTHLVDDSQDVKPSQTDSKAWVLSCTCITPPSTRFYFNLQTLNHPCTYTQPISC